MGIGAYHWDQTSYGIFNGTTGWTSSRNPVDETEDLPPPPPPPVKEDKPMIRAFQFAL